MRRFRIALAFLLVGAVLNVAVAWACTALLDPQFQEHYSAIHPGRSWAVTKGQRPGHTQTPPPCYQPGQAEIGSKNVTPRRFEPKSNRCPIVGGEGCHDRLDKQFAMCLNPRRSTLVHP